MELNLKPGAGLRNPTAVEFDDQLRLPSGTLYHLIKVQMTGGVPSVDFRCKHMIAHTKSLNLKGIFQIGIRKFNDLENNREQALI